MTGAEIALVIGLCSGNYGCDYALKAFYYQHPDIKVASRNAKNYVQQYVGREVMFIAPAIWAASTNRSFQLRLSRRWSIGRSIQNDNNVSYATIRWSYEF